VALGCIGIGHGMHGCNTSLQGQLRIEGVDVHVVVVHLGLIHASRERQVQRLGNFIATEVPAGAPLIVAGDFNDWGAQLHRPMADLDLRTFDGIRLPTYPSRLPLLHLDRIYVRGLSLLSAQVPNGRAWTRMSDHLPLIAELAL
jgi:endonuclease/exonuclease/phosphatase family metal-dependent hydrolase